MHGDCSIILPASNATKLEIYLFVKKKSRVLFLVKSVKYFMACLYTHAMNSRIFIYDFQTILLFFT